MLRIFIPWRITMTVVVCFLIFLLDSELLPFADAKDNVRIFSKSNLHVWAFEEYDKVNRSPDERARLLKELGIKKVGYVCRNKKRLDEFEAYVKAYKNEGIEIVSVWTPVNTDRPLEEPQIKGFLNSVDRYKLKVQWWVTLEHNFDKLPESVRVKQAVSRLRPLVKEANKRGCRLVIYGHGAKKWYTQCENQVLILENLKKEMPAAKIGIVFNFHHAHTQMNRFNKIFPKLKPHLVAVNLNGMHSKGPMIASLGKGDKEKDMIDIIYKSGWRGPVGIIGHNRSEDVKLTLQKNLDGLDSILKEIENPKLKGVEYPELSDDRLQITLYASDPDIVTPIGGVVDSQGRLYVIESHTHNPSRHYPGPKGDLIKVFEGVNDNGGFKKMSVFADGIHQAQALAFDKNGVLYVVCTREVLILHDKNKDGKSEARTQILHLDPIKRGGNPHGQLQGIAFSNDGWLYIGSRVPDDWIGSDKKRLRVGAYWGGIIARCRPDGSDLEKVAWGFWNPYSLAFDRHGRLLAIDNDPDHRGPNRLLHIVQGGDYGYKTQYGGTGLHPYQAWQGELPGTLPMIAGIGEAPTAVIDANTAALPLEYKDTIIGAAWGEHNLTLFKTRSAGASITASQKKLLEGLGHDNKVSPFRPSGLVASPVDGSIYVSDWMLINYTTHRKGRIWRISANPGIKTSVPRQPFSPQTPTAEFSRSQKLINASKVDLYKSLQKAMIDKDPFIRSAALTAMVRPVFRKSVIQDLEHKNEKIRLGAILALRRANVNNPAIYIEPRLKDSNIDVVLMAMIWAGEKRVKSLSAKIDTVVSRPDLTKDFLRVWLATLQILEGKLGAKFIESLVHDEKRPVMLRAMILRWLQDLKKETNHKFLKNAAQKSDPAIQIEAIRRLADSMHPEAQVILLDIARDQNQKPVMRTEAVASLAGKPDVSLITLLDDPVPGVQFETARSLRKLATNDAVLNAAKKKLAAIKDDKQSSSLKSQLEFLIAPENIKRPKTVEGWQKLLSKGGDSVAGSRVFFSANSSCIACHTVDGRGVKLSIGSKARARFTVLSFGPELSVIGRTANRDSIIHSIVKPSDQIAPEYQGWFVKMKSGQVHTGRQIDQGGSIELVMLDGKERHFRRGDVESWGAMKHSLMPEGIQQTMSIEEFRDLVAYLNSLR